ncbi:cyclic nucleotide-binding domain-containing protein [Desulforhopalus singaporensis]|uniref:Cyclic nucleotide-binding domain-containing protein n=1 Tax=Desulforhopalus singaporensis TaxID=91360 RepID=A0A1H0MLT2_9BACT|nr:cyclic nucleotide-binding domain-containing protein [Desulforhopalus singaporensis]SDO81362.1 Cyclic nucleotide-binding domain-containing protein [Desulforhopalus singaporensis]
MNRQRHKESSLSRGLAFLSERDREIMTGEMEEIFCRGGSTLFTMDEPAEGMYVLVEGRIAVQKPTGFGDRIQVVALLDPGAPVGEGGLLQGWMRSSTLVAVTDSRLLFLSTEAFEKLETDYPQLALKLVKWGISRLSMRLKKNSERLARIL